MTKLFIVTIISKAYYTGGNIVRSFVDIVNFDCDPRDLAANIQNALEPIAVENRKKVMDINNCYAGRNTVGIHIDSISITPID